MNFLPPEIALYLHKSTIHPCMECCCHVWAGALSWLGIVRQLQKRICRTVGPSLAASLEPLAHRQNVASLSLFYRYYFGRCSSELAHLVPLPFTWGKFTHYCDRLYDLAKWLSIHLWTKWLWVRVQLKSLKLWRFLFMFLTDLTSFSVLLFLFYQSPSSSWCMVFDANLSNIDEVLSGFSQVSCSWGKIIFKMLELTFYSKLDWDSYIISIAKTSSKKIGALIRSISLFLLSLLCISINLPYAHVWNTVVTSELVPLDATWNC